MHADCRDTRPTESAWRLQLIDTSCSWCWKTVPYSPHSTACCTTPATLGDQPHSRRTYAFSRFHCERFHKRSCSQGDLIHVHTPRAFAKHMGTWLCRDASLKLNALWNLGRAAPPFLCTLPGGEGWNVWVATFIPQVLTFSTVQ